MKKGLCWLLMLSMILSLFAGMAMAADNPATATPIPTDKTAFDMDNYAVNDVSVTVTCGKNDISMRAEGGLTLRVIDNTKKLLTWAVTGRLTP